jgi:hypothetical protein
MSKIKVEAFLSSLPESTDGNLLKILKEIDREYPGKVEIISHTCYHKLYEEYNLNALPALVIEELVKFVGFCPDKRSVVIALNESGLD